MELHKQWQLPLKQLQESVDLHLQDKSERVQTYSCDHYWQGRCFYLMLQLYSADQLNTDLGLFVCMDLAAGAVCSVTYYGAVEEALLATPGNLATTGAGTARARSATALALAPNVTASPRTSLAMATDV
jgi:hypothetical protein